MTQADLTTYQRVRIDAETLQEAMDHLVMTRSTQIHLMVVNNICCGVVTGKPAPAAKAPAAKALINDETTSSGLTLTTLTKEVVLRVMSSTPMRAMAIADALNLDRKDKSLRSKIGRLLIDLQNDKLVKGSSTGYHIHNNGPAQPNARKKVADAHKSPERSPLSRKDITLDMVLTQIRMAGEPIDSRTISDKIGLPRRAPSVRAKVTEALLGLTKDNVIRITGTNSNGRTYELAQT